MEILKIDDADKIKYMDLLLIADEQLDMIERYLYRGEMFALLSSFILFCFFFFGVRCSCGV